MPPLVFEESLCISECSAGYCLDERKERCITCDISCSTCFGRRSNNCLTCNIEESMFLIGSSCIQIKCVEGEYFDSEELICKGCNGRCKGCIGGESTDCVGCAEGKQLNRGECVKCEEANPKLITLNLQRGTYCSEICGDGYNMDILQCDDGNQIDGDGCDQYCRVEEGYLCNSGSSTSPDICSPTTSPTFTLNLISSINNNLLIQFDRPLITKDIQIKDLIQLRITGPLSNYSFDYNATKYLVKSQISQHTLNLLKNSPHTITPFFNQIIIRLQLYCSLTGSEEVYSVIVFKIYSI